MNLPEFAPPGLMTRLSIGARLVISFAVLLGLLLAVAAVSLTRIEGISAVTRSIVEQQAARLTLAQDANQHAQAAATRLFQLLITFDREQRIPIYTVMDGELAAADDAVAALGKHDLSPAERAHLERIIGLREHYDELFRETVEQVELDGPGSAREHFTFHTQPALSAFLKETAAFAADQQQTMRICLHSLDQQAARARLLVILLSSAALLLGAGSAWAIARSIVMPVGEALRVAQNIAQGDLRQSVPPGGSDETGQLLRALEAMRDSIASREDKILRLAYQDSLTGLPNRTRFSELCNQRNADERGAVALLDIDRFALINNALGHPVGDRLLCEIARRFAALDPAPRAVARLWGDQFVFLLADVGREDAAAFAEGALALLRDPITVDDQRLDVGGSIGIALYPGDGADAATLLRRAELAMKSAKQRRGRYAFAMESGAEPAHEHLSLIGEMREALERREFVVYYQPKFNIAAGHTTGTEALLRWAHPSKGLVPPFRFIPFAEQTGFIREITPWLLDEVIGHAAAWRKDGLAIVPSVNLSTLDLLEPQLVGYIGGLLAKHGLPAEGLCLEITESALMEEPELALKHLNELSALGLKLSIDDYGTGQASLAYLKTLPVNELKIDRAFIMAVNEAPKNAAIVRSTILLSHELGLTVVAEGAETQEELAWLKSSGCDLIQGYGIAKPMPLENFREWLGKEQPKL